MSRIGNSLQSVMIREIANNRTEMNELQRQLASGKVADSYGGLGSARTMSLALREEMTQIEGFRDTIAIAKSRVRVMNAAVGQMRDQASDTRGQLLVAGFEPMDNGRTLTQEQARVRLSDTIDLLNTQVAGRHLFAGTATDEPPVRPADEILNGAGGRAGFAQILDERRQADMGAGGLGRLVPGASPPSGVVLAEDVAGSPFGFKITALQSGLGGVATSGPAGTPAGISVDFSATLPQAGEKLTISLALPDGTELDLALTARAAGTADLQAGDFAIGADEVATSGNFLTALSAALAREAETSLSVASMQAAANDFFTSGGNIAQRVDGPPFDSATALRDATASDTVEWYSGDRSAANARETAIARVDENSLVAYGARADEEPFANLVKQFAVMSSASFDAASENDAARYKAMTDRVSANLSGFLKADSLDRVIGELSIAEGSLEGAEQRHIASDNMVTDFLADIETADINEVGAKLLSLQTQLQASYQVTSMLSRLSLANFL